MNTLSIKTLIILCAVSLVLGGAIGFFAGRKTIIKEKETVKYLKGEVIRDTIMYPVPVKETLTTIQEKLLPGKVTVIHDTIITEVDTAAIVNDYMIKREYSQKFFDSKEQGKLIVNSSVQYNKQTALSIDYEPVIKEVTKTQILKPVYIPFVTGGYNNFNHGTVGVGLFYHNAGIEANYIRDFTLKQNGFGGKLLIKF